MFILNLIFASFFTIIAAFYEESEHVVDLNEDNFENEVINNKDIWLLQFFATDDNDCYEYSTEYETIGKTLDGFIKVGAVDVDKARLLAFRYNVKKLPTIIYIDKDKISTKHKGGTSAADLINLAVELISKQLNETLEEKFINLPFVRQFTQDDINNQVKISGRTMVAYYSSEDNDLEIFKTSFIHLVTKLQDVVKFGYYDVNKFGEMDGVNSTPTVIYYYGRRSKRNEKEFNGTFDQEDELTSWALSNIKKPEILEMHDEAVLRDACINKKYCIIGLIPNWKECDTDCKLGYKDHMSAFAEKYKHYSVTWALVRQNMMKILEDLFEITKETELPVLITVNVQTLRSKTLVGADENNAEEFLEDVFHGNGLPESRLPAFDNLLLDHYKPWHDEL